MLFLLRTAFWFSLVLLALPLGAASTGGDGEPVGPVDAFLAARDAVGDLSGLCGRKPDVCRTGAVAMSTIGARARESGRLAFDLLDQRFGRAQDLEGAAPGVPNRETDSDKAIVTGSVDPRGTAEIPALPERAPVPPAR